MAQIGEPENPYDVCDLHGPYSVQYGPCPICMRTDEHLLRILRELKLLHAQADRLLVDRRRGK